MFKTKAQNNKGFSLLEIIVALGVFSIVVVVAAGALLKIVDAGKKAQAMKAVMNNLHFAMESMSREIRTGTKYRCAATLAGLNTQIDSNSPAECEINDAVARFFAFEPAVFRDLTNPDERYAYRYNTTTKALEKAESISGNFNESDFEPVTSSEVEILEMRFLVTGTAANDQEPGKVLVTIRGNAGVKSRLQSEFTMHSTITQRIRE